MMTLLCITVEHFVDLLVFFEEVIWNGKLPGQVTELPFLFGFVDDQIHQGQVVSGNDHLFPLANHID